MINNSVLIDNHTNDQGRSLPLGHRSLFKIRIFAIIATIGSEYGDSSKATNVILSKDAILILYVVVFRHSSYYKPFRFTCVDLLLREVKSVSPQWPNAN